MAPREKIITTHHNGSNTSNYSKTAFKRPGCYLNSPFSIEREESEIKQDF